MKNTLLRRFALLALLGGILSCGMLVGCGSGEDDGGDATGNAAPAKDKDAGEEK